MGVTDWLPKVLHRINSQIYLYISPVFLKFSILFFCFMPTLVLLCLRNQKLQNKRNLRNK